VDFDDRLDDWRQQQQDWSARPRLDVLASFSLWGSRSEDSYFEGDGGDSAEEEDMGGEDRARSHCRFVPPLTHLTPNSLTHTYSVPLFLNRQRDRTLGGDSDPAAAAAAGRARMRARALAALTS
jgi:hypothetical protein